MKALSIKSDREIWLVDVAATSPVSPTVTVQGTDKVLPPEPIEKNTLRHPLMMCTRKPVQRILQKNSRTLPVRIYRVNTKEGYDDSSPGSFFELFPPRSHANCESLLRTIAELEGTNPDYVSVTYAGDAKRRQKTLALLDHLVHETSLTPLAHLICAGHSVHELERAVRLILGLGVRGFLALRGDIQEGQVSELPFARYLVELIRRVEREDFAHLAAGKVSIGVAAYPQKHPSPHPCCRILRFCYPSSVPARTSRSLRCSLRMNATVPWSIRRTWQAWIFRLFRASCR